MVRTRKLCPQLCEPDFCNSIRNSVSVSLQKHSNHVGGTLLLKEAYNRRKPLGASDKQNQHLQPASLGTAVFDDTCSLTKCLEGMEGTITGDWEGLAEECPQHGPWAFVSQVTVQAQCLPHSDLVAMGPTDSRLCVQIWNSV